MLLSQLVNIESELSDGLVQNQRIPAGIDPFPREQPGDVAFVQPGVTGDVRLRLVQPRLVTLEQLRERATGDETLLERGVGHVQPPIFKSLLKAA